MDFFEPCPDVCLHLGGVLGKVGPDMQAAYLHSTGPQPLHLNLVKCLNQKIMPWMYKLLIKLCLAEPHLAYTSAEPGSSGDCTARLLLLQMQTQTGCLHVCQTRSGVSFA